MLQMISHHTVSGDPLSQEQAEQVSKAMTFMAGYDLTKELYLSTLDLEVYSTWVHLRGSYFLKVRKS